MDSFANIAQEPDYFCKIMYFSKTYPGFLCTMAGTMMKNGLTFLILNQIITSGFAWTLPNTKFVQSFAEDHDCRLVVYYLPDHTQDTVVIEQRKVSDC